MEKLPDDIELKKDRIEARAEERGYLYSLEISILVFDNVSYSSIIENLIVENLVENQDYRREEKIVKLSFEKFYQVLDLLDKNNYL